MASSPLKIGSPAWPESAYSGIRLKIDLTEAPADLRFSTGQAAWLTTAGATIVDTEWEQSVVTLDTNQIVPLTPAPSFGIPQPLIMGDLLPPQYYGTVGRQEVLNAHVQVEYRLVGTTEYRQGAFSSVIAVPEPHSGHMAILGAWGLLLWRAKRRSTGRNEGGAPLGKVDEHQPPSATGSGARPNRAIAEIEFRRLGSNRISAVVWRQRGCPHPTAAESLAFTAGRTWSPPARLRHE